MPTNLPGTDVVIVGMGAVGGVAALPLARAGLKVLDAELNSSNGGHFSVTFARDDSRRAVNERALADLRRREAEMALLRPETWQGFAQRVTRHRTLMQEFFVRQVAAGRRTLGYGASTKGNVVLQYCGLTSRELPVIAERDPYKYGLVTPGSRVVVAFDANNPGWWAMHCHLLYHMDAGMFTTLRYV